MDAFELLKADHKKVAELFDQLDAASGKAKLNVFQQIKSELELHASIEETIFYPALEEPEETHDLTLEAYEEHEMVKTLLAELDGAESADDQWQAKAKVLRENVEHHVDEEENELFDKAKDALSDEQIESLGERMETAKAQEQGRPPAPTRAVTKSSESSKSSTEKPGILAKIANLVGLGGGTSRKRAAKKASAKKKPAARKATKVTVKPASKKASKKAASKSKKAPSTRKGSKSRVATVSKRASAGSKKASASRSSGARKKSSTGSAKKAAKSRARGK